MADLNLAKQGAADFRVQRAGLLLPLVLTACLEAAHAQTPPANATPILDSPPGTSEQPATPTPRIAFDIPAQSIETALTAFGQQSGLTIAFETKDGRGRQSPAVSGMYTPEEALRKILEATDLRAEYLDNRTVVVHLANATGNAGGNRSSDARREANLRLAQVAATRNTGASAGESGVGSPMAQVDERQSTARDPGIEEMVVTGSHIRRTEGVGALPVKVVTQTEIRNAGHGSLKDYLQTLTQNVSSQNQETGSGYDYYGRGTGFNLRGLGPESTLTLVDGRRLVASSSATGNYADISSIPLAAIERVEILTDGASSIYGSDAVGGVVNVIMRDQFSGVAATGRYGDDTHGDSPEWSAGLSLGQTWSSGGVIATYEHFDRSPLLAADRDRSRSGDQRARGGSDFRLSYYGQPGTVQALDGTLPGVAGGVALIPAGQDGTALTPADFTPGYVRIANNFETMIPGERRDSAFAKIHQDLTDGLRAFATVLYSKSELEITLAPNFVDLIPASNAFNPFGEDVYVYYRPTRELGSEYFLVQAERSVYSIGVGLEGKLGSAWQWELSGSRGRDRNDAGIPSQNWGAPGLADSNPATAFNVFGDGSRQAPNFLRDVYTVVTQGSVTRSSEALLKLDGPLFELPGGKVLAAFGAQYRTDEYYQELTNADRSLYETPKWGDRHLTSVFSEVIVPLFGAPNRRPGLYAWELNLSSRYEDYSDFGDTTTYKAGTIWRPSESWALRASFGTSFRAPLLSQVYGTGGTSSNNPLSNRTFIDYRRGNEAVSVPYYAGASPNLEPQTSDNFSAGITFEPVSVPGLSLEASYFDIKYDNQIQGAGQIVAIYDAGREDLLPAGIVVRAAPTPADQAAGLPGRIVMFDARNFNGGVANVEGIDMRVAYGTSTALGRLDLALDTTYTMTHKFALVPGYTPTDYRGTSLGPTPWRGRMTAGWSKGMLGLNAAVNYVDDYTNTATTTGVRDVDSYVTVDVGAVVDLTGRFVAALEDLKLRFNVVNALDELPPFYNRSLGYDPRYGSLRGRVLSLTVESSF